MPDKNRRQKKSGVASIRSPLKLLTAIEVRGERIDIAPEPGNVAAVVALEEYIAWLDGMKDDSTVATIEYHVNKLGRGVMGDWKDVGGIFEMRINYGPGYRVYFAKYGNSVFVIALGGDKSSQRSDIASAIAIWKEVKNGIKEIRD